MGATYTIEWKSHLNAQPVKTVAVVSILGTYVHQTTSESVEVMHPRGICWIVISVTNMETWKPTKQ